MHARAWRTRADPRARRGIRRESDGVVETQRLNKKAFFSSLDSPRALTFEAPEL